MMASDQSLLDRMERLEDKYSLQEQQLLLCQEELLRLRRWKADTSKELAKVLSAAVCCNSCKEHTKRVDKLQHAFNFAIVKAQDNIDIKSELQTLKTWVSGLGFGASQTVSKQTSPSPSTSATSSPSTSTTTTSPSTDETSTITITPFTNETSTTTTASTDETSTITTASTNETSTTTTPSTGETSTTTTPSTNETSTTTTPSTDETSTTTTASTDETSITATASTDETSITATASTDETSTTTTPSTDETSATPPSTDETSLLSTAGTFETTPSSTAVISVSSASQPVTTQLLTPSINLSSVFDLWKKNYPGSYLRDDETDRMFEFVMSNLTKILRWKPAHTWRVEYNKEELLGNKMTEKGYSFSRGEGIVTVPTSIGPWGGAQGGWFFDCALEASQIGEGELQWYITTDKEPFRVCSGGPFRITGGGKYGLRFECLVLTTNQPGQIYQSDRVRWVCPPSARVWVEMFRTSEDVTTNVGQCRWYGIV